MIARWRTIIALLGCACLAMPAHGQSKDKQERIPDWGTLLGAADAPAFDALGKAASDVSTPTTGRDVIAGLLNGMDQNGDFTSGIAIQFSPLLVLQGRSLTPRDYVANQSFARFNLTVATARSADDEKGLLASAGFVWTPVAGDDPYGDRQLVDCLTAWVEEKPDLPADIQPGANPPSEDSRAQLQRCRDTFTNKAKFNLQIGFAGVFFSPTGKTDDLRGQGIFGNGTLRYELPRSKLSVTTTVAYRTNEPTPDPKQQGAFLTRDRLSAGARLSFGTLGKSAFGIEAVYQNADYGSLVGKDNYATYVGTLSWRISDALWLNLKAGGSSGKRLDGNAAFFGTSLSWGSEPAIKIGSDGAE